IIGGITLAIIWSVWAFPREARTELIESGQMIQAATVTLLLSIVMVLALALVLHEQAVGTLLGGLAGYILSQGVGRAVAREVRRFMPKPAGEHKPEAEDKSSDSPALRTIVLLSMIIGLGIAAVYVLGKEPMERMSAERTGRPEIAEKDQGQHSAAGPAGPDVVWFVLAGVAGGIVLG